jgi:hypothetical protein
VANDRHFVEIVRPDDFSTLRLIDYWPLAVSGSGQWPVANDRYFVEILRPDDFSKLPQKQSMASYQ